MNMKIYTKKQEIMRTAELMKLINKERGLYFAFALFRDSGRHSLDEIDLLLKYLEKKGAKNEKDK